MKTRDREHATLSFAQPGDRGAVEETFYPWDLTVRRFLHEGLPPAIGEKILEANAGALHTPKNPMEKYLQAAAYEGVFDYEIWLGFDPVRRVALTLPLRGRVLVVQVLSLAVRRGPASEARLLYREIGEQNEGARPADPCGDQQTASYRAP